MLMARVPWGVKEVKAVAAAEAVTKAEKEAAVVVAAREANPVAAMGEEEVAAAVLPVATAASRAQTCGRSTAYGWNQCQGADLSSRSARL